MFKLKNNTFFGKALKYMTTYKIFIIFMLIFNI